MGRLVWLVVLAACAHAPAAVPAPEPAQPEDAADPRYAAIALPPPVVPTSGLAAPAHDDDLWERGAGPLERPHLDIAAAYDATGHWSQLCAARGEPRRTSERDDLLAYLYAWCAIATGHDDRGIALLAPLVAARSLRIARAAADDLIEAVTHRSGPDARFALGNWQIASLENLGQLAEQYLALGRIADAAVVNPHVLPGDRDPTARCRGLVRAYVLRSWPRRDVTRAIEQGSAEPVCDAARRMFRCPAAYGPWQLPSASDVAEYNAAGCDELVAEHPELAPRIDQARIYALMPTERRSQEWLGLAWAFIDHGFASSDDENIALSALEIARTNAGYAADRQLAIAQAALAIRAAKHHDRGFDRRIDTVLTPPTHERAGQEQRATR